MSSSPSLPLESPLVSLPSVLSEWPVSLGQDWGRGQGPGTPSSPLLAHWVPQLCQVQETGLLPAGTGQVYTEDAGDDGAHHPHPPGLAALQAVPHR